MTNLRKDMFYSASCYSRRYSRPQLPHKFVLTQKVGEEKSFQNVGSYSIFQPTLHLTCIFCERVKPPKKRSAKQTTSNPSRSTPGAHDFNYWYWSIHPVLPLMFVFPRNSLNSQEVRYSMWREISAWCVRVVGHSHYDYNDDFEYFISFSLFLNCVITVFIRKYQFDVFFQKVFNDVLCVKFVVKIIRKKKKKNIFPATYWDQSRPQEQQLSESLELQAQELEMLGCPRRVSGVYKID